MVRIISSQHYLDDAIVAAKREAGDYSVLLSPVFAFDGEELQVVLDGHHSLAAAKADGAEPEYDVATSQISDKVALIERGEIKDFLAVTHMDGDWYDVATGKAVW